MNSFERFDGTGLLAIEEVFSKLARKGITDEEYANAKDWAELGCKSLGDYHDVFLKSVF